MNEPIEIVRGATGARLAGTLSTKNPAILPNLTGATVTVRMKAVNNSAVVLDAAGCTIDDAIARHVYHEFSAGDFTTLSLDENYLVQFKVQRSDGKVVYIPDQDRNYFTVKVKAPI
jgi:hypothetical protein